MMKLYPWFKVSVLAMAGAVWSPAQSEWVLLDDFEGYGAGESIRGKGMERAWRTQGWAPAGAAEIRRNPAGDGMVLGFGPRKMAVYEHLPTFYVPEFGMGTLHFRLFPPAQGATDNQAFYLILKTRAQADADLTRPNNGVLLLQFQYRQDGHGYRLMLEGPGSSPTNVLLPADEWSHIWVLLDHGNQAYRVYLGQDARSIQLVTNHRYPDGVVPYKNRTGAPIELIYLRNQSIGAEVLVDDLAYLRDEQHAQIPRLR